MDFGDVEWGAPNNGCGAGICLGIDSGIGNVDGDELRGDDEVCEGFSSAERSPNERGDEENEWWTANGGLSC